MKQFKIGFQALCVGGMMAHLVACQPGLNVDPLPTPEPSFSSSPEVPKPTASPRPEPTRTPEPLPSEEPIPDQARPQDVVLDLTLNNIASEFSAYYGATLTVERKNEGIIHQQYFFPSTELSKHLRFQPGDLTTGQDFTVSLRGTPDGNCLNQVSLGLKPAPTSMTYLETSAYRQAIDWEILLNGADFTRLPADLSCAIGYALEGQVMDEDGELLDGVSVLAEITGDEKMIYRNLQITAEPGVFSLSSLPAGLTLKLAFSKPGYRSFQTSYLPPVNGTQSDRLKIFLKKAS